MPPERLMSLCRIENEINRTYMCPPGNTLRIYGHIYPLRLCKYLKMPRTKILSFLYVYKPEFTFRKIDNIEYWSNNNKLMTTQKWLWVVQDMHSRKYHKQHWLKGLLNYGFKLFVHYIFMLASIHLNIHVHLLCVLLHSREIISRPLASCSHFHVFKQCPGKYI